MQRRTSKLTWLVAAVLSCVCAWQQAQAGALPDGVTHLCTLEDGDVHCWDMFEVVQLTDCDNPTPLTEDTERPGFMRVVIDGTLENIDIRYGSRFFEPDFGGFGFDAVVLVPMQNQISFEGGFASSVEDCVLFERFMPEQAAPTSQH
jgi:hypothetical protein